jgi:polar amino acid transport system permease protein
MHALLGAIDGHLLWRRTIGELTNPDGQFWAALWRTLYISIAAQVLGILLGLVAALMRMSRLWPFRILSGLYVLVFRGTPVIVQIFFVYFGANLLFGVNLIRDTNFGAFTLSAAVLAGIIALGINEGAYMREIIRAGIDSIDRGQMEAAKSLGMPYRLAMRRIILPQAARVIVPPLGNEFNNMMKTTSLIFFIGVTELFGDAEIRYSTSFKPVEYFLAVAFWYLVLTSAWSLIQAQIERRLGASELADADSWWTRLTSAWSLRGAMLGGEARGAR